MKTLNEISSDLISRYGVKATSNALSSGRAGDFSTHNKRAMGLEMAKNKLWGSAKVKATGKKIKRPNGLVIRPIGSAEALKRHPWNKSGEGFHEVGEYSNKEGSPSVMYQHDEDPKHHVLVLKHPEWRDEPMDHYYGSSKEFHKHLTKRGLVGKLNEDVVPVNNIGAGAIQGAGTGPYPQSEPGVPKKRLKVILNNAKMLTRKSPRA